MFNCTCDCLCRVLENCGLILLALLLAFAVSFIICWVLVLFVDAVMKAKDIKDVRMIVTGKTMSIMGVVLAFSFVISVILAFVPAKDNSTIDFKNSFPILFAILSFYVSIIVSLTTYFYQKKEEKEKEQQETTLHNDLEDIKQQLKDIKDNLPTTQDTSTSDDSFLSRLLRSLCGEK